MTGAELIHLIEDDGWDRVGVRGSHRQYIHPHKPGRVLTLRRHLTEEVGMSALRRVLRQAGLEP
jgi:predicted RNA binding protein YcfA (HicA-like mRNA interferase family)